MLIGIGIIMIILGYLTFDSISKANEAAAKQLNEQNEMMLKASKAIYLATKRNTQEAQKQHAQNIKAIEYMMNNMISNEKDMVNAMITKTKKSLQNKLLQSQREMICPHLLNSFLHQMPSLQRRFSQLLQLMSLLKPMLI